MPEDGTCAIAEVNRPAISVVVIGRNEGTRLVRCIESVRQAHGITIREIIYVDSASTDGSPEFASHLGATVIVVRPERPTAAIGRNVGWRHAASDLILFLDGDTILDPDFAFSAYEVLSQDVSLAAVWGHRREIHPETSLYNRVLDLDWMYRAGLSEFCGGDVLMRRDALVKTRGFDETLIAGEEPELCRRIRNLGYGILHIDCPMTGHDLEILRWSQYWKRATRAGYAYASVSEKFRMSADPFWTADRRRNMMRGSFWGVSFIVSVVASLWAGVLPFVLWLSILLLASIRSAWKARWKGASPGVLLLYGLHSHLQQLPILFGQLQFQLGKRRKKAQRLIEYKGRPVA
jgi:glycosyltransferase involved in cell wall biosynthesis